MPSAWADALGKSERATDWREFFAEELANASFRDVLTRWLPRLSAGISGSAAHGIIRASHVARALAVNPHLPVGVHWLLLRHIWQLDAAVYATHAMRGAAAPRIDTFASADDLVAAAVDSRDEHAIKFTEVSLREDAAAPDPSFRRAAAHWVRVSLPA